MSTVSFARIADTLRCSKQRERVRIPARWIIERVHGHKVRVRVPAQTRTIKVVKCHPRVVKRRVFVGGRWVVKRIVVLPRTVQRSTKRVRFGGTAVVSGWLGTSRGVALGGQRVDVITAPDNGEEAFSLAADGNDGCGRNLERAASARPLADHPRHVRGLRDDRAGLVIDGPRDRARFGPALHQTPTYTLGRDDLDRRPFARRQRPALRRDRSCCGSAGAAGRPRSVISMPDATARFRSSYTFLRGNGTETYRIWAATARESDYPYAPARSRRVSVTVGP